jgi:hypothetical protein
MDRFAPLSRSCAGQPERALVARVGQGGWLLFFDLSLWFGGLLDLHIAELFGVKDLATLQALDKLSVFEPGNDTYPGMLADGCHRFGFSGITTLSARL